MVINISNRMIQVLNEIKQGNIVRNPETLEYKFTTGDYFGLFNRLSI